MRSLAQGQLAQIAVKPLVGSARAGHNQIRLNLMSERGDTCASSKSGGRCVEVIKQLLSIFLALAITSFAAIGLTRPK